MSGATEDQTKTEAQKPTAAEAAAAAPEGQKPPAAAVASETPAPAAGRGGLDFVLDVPLRVTVEIGSAQMRVAELLQVDKGSVIELDRLAGEPADLLVNGRFVARGEVTVVEERLAVRILEIDGRNVVRGAD